MEPVFLPFRLHLFISSPRWYKFFPSPAGGLLKRPISFSILLLSSVGLASLFAQNPLFAQNSANPHQVPLPTSKQLTVPSPGRIGSLNSFPANIALTPDGRYAAFLNDGYGTQANRGYQSIAVLDFETNQILEFPDERLPEDAHQSYFLGLAFSSDGNYLYTSMGSITDPTGERPRDTGNGIAVYRFQQGKVTPERFIKIAPQSVTAGKKIAFGLRKTALGTAIPYPAGLAVVAGKSGDRLLVANNFSDNVVLLEATDGRVLQRFDLSTHEMIPASYPYTVVATRDGRRAWCSLWNASQVAELDLTDGKVVRWIKLNEPSDPLAPGSHPTALLLSPDEKILYVALSNADTVAVVATDAGLPFHLLNTGIRGQKLAGTYPNALAQSADGSRLFVADASLNAVGVFDTSGLMRRAPTQNSPSAALGFIPTDWYPSALAVRGNDLLIASAKGEGTGPNNFPGHTDYERRHREKAYIPTLLAGSVARLKISEVEKRLDELTRQVFADNLLRNDPGQIRFAQGTNPIRHVIYVIKENRTYDQVLGDLKVGNGDAKLTMYGADITPNERKLALQFGVLDNFYDSGEVSGDGHDWSTAAITSDYNEKTWQIVYRSKQRSYDFQGTVAEELPLENGQPDVDAPSTGYLWDNAASHNLTYRDYGEFTASVWCKSQREKHDPASPQQKRVAPLEAACQRTTVNKGEKLPPNVGDPHGSASPWPWPVPLLRESKPTKAVLRGHYDPLFPEFETDYPDQLRADEFLNEFAGFVQARKERNGTELPAFVLLYLPDDHTGGTRPGRPRPAASVADNDLALGRVVEAVSHSAYWDDTAIFVVEDDAQDGADHVDAHRSIAFVISKYSPGSVEHPFVDSGLYTTVSMIHTIEALLGLPPMNQNDAHAPLMAPLFSGAGNQPPFTADWSNRDNGLIYQVNPAKGQGSKASAKMDFSRPDAASNVVLNRILWRDRKGNTPMPVPKHPVFAQKAARDDD
jgi:WD40 repeat protein